MAEVSSNNVISHQNYIHLDIQINDFAELSDLLGDDLSSDGQLLDLEKSPLENSKEMKETASSLPEFNLNWATKETLNVDLSSKTSNGVASTKKFGQTLEPARVSPTPSSSTSFSITILDSMPLLPINVLPQQVSSLAKTNKSSSYSRKRKNSDTDEHSYSKETRPNPWPAVQKNNRRERNREHAKRSRSKKKDFTKQLEETVTMLTAENQKLKDMLYEKLQTNKEDTEKMIKERVMTPSDRFIAALKNPSNRVMGISSISYLKSLGKDCIKIS